MALVPFSTRVEASQRDALAQYVEANGVSASDVIRELLDNFLGTRPERELKKPTSISIAPHDRYQMAIMHDILARLDDEPEDGFHRRASEVLREGYTGEYGNLLGSLRPEIPRAECVLLWDILDMFRVLKTSMARLESPLDDRERSRLTFQGLDGNDTREGALLAYLRFLLGSGRWSDLSEDVEAADGGNSHARMLTVYERMLAVFTPIWRDIVRDRVGGGAHLDLSVGQLREVAAAAR